MSFFRSTLWVNAKSRSYEYFTLSNAENDYIFKGTVIAANKKPTLGNYEIRCNKDWLTRAMYVRKESGETTKELALQINDDQRWFSGGSSLGSMKGVFDVDFDFSPSTNTLPIRRLNLAIGEEKMVDSVWVRLEGLTLERLSQKYTRIDETHYLYDTLSGFRALLEVDDLGLIVCYGDLWHRI